MWVLEMTTFAGVDRVAGLGERGGALGARVDHAVADVRRLVLAEPALRVDRHEHDRLGSVTDEERANLQRVVRPTRDHGAVAVAADVHRRRRRDVDDRGADLELRRVRRVGAGSRWEPRDEQREGKS